MPKLTYPVMLFAAALTAAAAPAALAEGNTALYSAAAGLDQPDRQLTDETLFYAGAHPVSVLNAPENLYLARSTTRHSSRDLECLAEALYFEARGEGRKGQAAVAEVILNRVDSRAFPSTICGVVNQRAQFSYTIGGKKPIRNRKAYARVHAVAKAALEGGPRNLTGGATYFHTPSVRPKWASRFQRTVRIGQHIFYRTGRRLASN